MQFKLQNLFPVLFFALLLSLFSLSQCAPLKVVNSFKQLGEHHCSQFPIDLLWRLSTGTISEKYGQQYYDYDCYIRQFVRKDGLVIQSTIQGDDEEDEEDEEEDEQGQGMGKQLAVDPVVREYAQGLKLCLPEGVDPIEGSYSIWRFFRFLIQHDYIYQWMRARIRATLGYEAQRPNSWMDGQNSAQRLRLDKLFSNQFYQYLDTLMFKDYLYPLLTFFHENKILVANSKSTMSGKPIMFQSLETHNFFPKIFQPVLLNLSNIRPTFSYTVPGFPLLLGGSSQNLVWSFTGILVDRTNIQEIETVGNKFYHHDTEQWLKLQQEQIEIPGVEGKVCKFMHSGYGPLYTKNQRQGKNQEYIVKWHQKENKVRTFFSDLLKFIQKDGNIQQGQSLEFPFNSIMYANQKGVFQYLCQQFYPSYFIYPDMFGQPEKLPQRHFSYPTKKFLSVSNSYLTTSNQSQYSKLDALTPFDQQSNFAFKSLKTSHSVQSFLSFAHSISATPHIKKQRETLTRIYRKVKFLYLPQETHRKKCDILISMLDKWNNGLEQKISPIYILWEYFLRQYTFNYVSASQYGQAVIKHKILTDNYWVGQMALWEKGTSYGECDCDQYEKMKHEVNGTGHNSSCYFNIIKAINATKDALLQHYDGDFTKIDIKDFVGKKFWSQKGVENGFLGSNVEQAFKNYYSRNLMFVAQVGNPNIIYYQGYNEEQKKINLSQFSKRKQNRKDEVEEEEYIDTDL